MASPDFDEIADVLYTLAPADFTAARNARADEVKRTDRPLAGRIRALRRPTLAAWAANLLAHRHRELVGRLLELGQALRDAQEHLAGDQLRGLVDRRRELVRALTERAHRDAAAAGHPLGADALADLDRTLSAALADPDAARALAEGRLTTALEPPLWPGAAPDGAGTDGAAPDGAAPYGAETVQPDIPADAGPGTGSGTGTSRERAKKRSVRPTATDDRRAAARARAERERARERARAREEAGQAVGAAEEAEREAADRAAAADRELRRAGAARRSAQDEADQAEADLQRARARDDRARDALVEADDRVRAAEDAVDSAGDRVSRAREAVREAAERLRQLDDGG